jgi:hypothetical protein
MRIKKIQAFTLSEMLVVLLLTVIVVGLAFTILNLVQQQMNSTRENYQKGSEINSLRQALWKDFRSHSTIYYNDVEQELFFKNPINEVRYAFVKDYLIRGRDTFKIELTDKIFLFNGVPVTSGNVTGLELVTGKKMQNRKVFVYKELTSDYYMND